MTEKQAWRAVEESEEPDIPELLGGPLYTIARIRDAKPPEWLINDTLPRGSMGFIAGVPKSFKSYVALDIAVSCAAGINFVHKTTHVAKVLYVQEEDPDNLVKANLAQVAPPKELTPFAGEEWENNFHMLHDSGFRFTDPHWTIRLRRYIDKHKIELIVFDTLTVCAGGIDLNKVEIVRPRILDPLARLAKETGVTIIMVHHMSKAGDSVRPGVNMSGSGQIYAWATFGMYVTHAENHLLKIWNETKYAESTQLSFDISSMKTVNGGMWIPKDAGMDLDSTERVTVIKDEGSKVRLVIGDGPDPSNVYQFKPKG